MPAKATIAGSVRAKPWLIVLGIVMASCAGLVGVFGPRLARSAKGLYGPISKMKSEQQDFESWNERRAWKEPAAPELSAAKLDAFLLLRKELLDLEARSEGVRREFPEGRKPSLDEISGLMEGVGSLVAGQLAAFRRHDITPAEYEYLKRLVYRTWLQALTAQGLDPAARLAAAREIEAAAETERNAAAKERLRQVARSLRERRPPAPEGVPPEVHELLLDRASEIQALLAPSGEAPIAR